MQPYPETANCSSYEKKKKRYNIECLNRQERKLEMEGYNEHDMSLTKN